MDALNIQTLMENFCSVNPMSVDGLKMDSVLTADVVEEFVRVQFGSDYNRVGGSERLYHCPNPNHPDHKKSCSVNVEKRVYNCHGCDFHGSFYHWASHSA